jgi:hypothetical protein
MAFGSALNFIYEDNKYKVQQDKSLCLMPRQKGWFGDRTHGTIILGPCKKEIPEISWKQIDDWGRIWSMAGGCMLPKEHNVDIWSQDYDEEDNPVFFDNYSRSLGPELEWVFKDGEGPCHQDQWAKKGPLHGPCKHFSWGANGAMSYCGKPLRVSQIEDGAEVTIETIKFHENSIRVVHDS